MFECIPQSTAYTRPWTSSSHHIVGEECNGKSPNSSHPLGEKGKEPAFGQREPFIQSFIHSDHFYSAPSSPLATTHRRSRLQHGYCIGVSRRSAQATVGKEL